MSSQDKNSGCYKEVEAGVILGDILKGRSIEYDGILIKGDLDFRNIALPTVSVDNKQLYLVKSIFKIENSKIEGNIYAINGFFKEDFILYNIITKSIFLEGSTFQKNLNLEESYFDGGVYARKTKCLANASFTKVSIAGNARFDEAEFKGSISFQRSCFLGDCYFENCIFIGAVDFRKVMYQGEFISFKRAQFGDPGSQEIACRIAKKISGEQTDKENFEYYYYREMDAKRKQKSLIIQYLELLFAQWIFGYGVYPLRIISTWIIFILTFTLIYYFGEGICSGAIVVANNESISIMDCFYFSTINGATSGFGNYVPNNDLFMFLASFQAILGMFLWAGFIATFSIKYLNQ